MPDHPPRMLFEFDSDFSDSASIKVVGVGGAGGNAVARMISAGLSGVDFININTDAQVLSENQAVHRIQIGRKLTKGLGSGGDPDVGRKAVEEDLEAIAERLFGADMVFVTAGMGGGTGTGASPTVARVARECGALTVGVVTKPFDFEGRRRSAVAEAGLAQLRNEVDTLITIPNQRLFEVVAPETPFTEAFGIADDVLLQATQGISDLITVTGLINLDFADVKSIMKDGGPALMGTGFASGDERAEQAARAAISCPLLEEQKIEGAKGVLINMCGSNSMTIQEVTKATTIITDAVGDEANIIFGAVIDESVGEQLRITVIATGFDTVNRGVFPVDLELGQNRPEEAVSQQEIALSAAAGVAGGTVSGDETETTSPGHTTDGLDAESVDHTDSEANTCDQEIEIVTDQSQPELNREFFRQIKEEAQGTESLSGEVTEMRAEVLPELTPTAATDDWDIPTFLRKQND